jgi:hypothetical protein
MDSHADSSLPSIEYATTDKITILAIGSAHDKKPANYFKKRAKSVQISNIFNDIFFQTG